MTTVQNDYNFATSANGKPSLCLIGNWAEENAMLAATGIARAESLSQAKLDTHADDRAWQSNSHATHHAGCSALALNSHVKKTVPTTAPAPIPSRVTRNAQPPLIQTVLIEQPKNPHNALPRKSDIAEQKRMQKAVALIEAKNSVSADTKHQNELHDTYGHKPKINRQKIVQKPIMAATLNATSGGAAAAAATEYPLTAPAITVHSHKKGNSFNASMRGFAPGGELAGTNGPEFVEGSTSSVHTRGATTAAGQFHRSTHFSKPSARTRMADYDAPPRSSRWCGCLDVQPGSRMDEYFKLSERGSTLWTEIRAGFVTFVTMAYILVVNPQILSAAGTSTTGGAFEFTGIATATALCSAFACAMVGLVGNLPFGLAPGMGLNSYFTYGVVMRLGLTYQIGLTCVFFQGLLFLVCALTGLCTLIQVYSPACIKKSITVGLGIFQALIGYDAIRLVVQGQDTLLTLGTMNSDVWLALAGVIFIVLCLIGDVKAAMLLGIIFVTGVSWACGLAPLPTEYIAWPSIESTFFQLDFIGYFREWQFTLPVTLVFLFVCIFDTAGVQFAAGAQAKLLDHNDQLPNSKAAFASSAVATTIGSMLGTSPLIIHNESIAGIQDGARTGISALTVSALFLVSLPFTPLLRSIPAIATAPPLILVGMFMMVHAKFIDWESVDQALPAFLTLTLIPLTYSIAVGMTFGLGSFFVLYTFTYAGRKIFGQPLPPPAHSDPLPQHPRSPFVRPDSARRASLSAGIANFQLGGTIDPQTGNGISSARGTAYGAVPNDELRRVRMSMYLRLKRKQTTIFLACDRNEKLVEAKKRAAQILDVAPADLRFHEYLTDAQRAQRELDKSREIAAPNMDKKSKKKEDIKKLEAAKTKPDEELLRLLAAGALDETKTIDALGLDNDRIVFYVLRTKEGFWEEIDVDGLQAGVPNSIAAAAAAAQAAAQAAAAGKPGSTLPPPNAAGARPLSSPMAPSQTPSASALAQFQTATAAAQPFAAGNSALLSPPIPPQK